jgi:hypothetical protein
MQLRPFTLADGLTFFSFIYSRLESFKDEAPHTSAAAPVPRLSKTLNPFAVPDAG